MTGRSIGFPNKQPDPLSAISDGLLAFRRRRISLSPFGPRPPSAEQGRGMGFEGQLKDGRKKCP